MELREELGDCMENMSGNDDLGACLPTVQTIGHKKIRLPAPCRACSKIGPVFSTFTMISAYFSISQIENPYEIRVFFLGISPTFHQRVTFVALGSTGAPVTLPGSHLLNGHLYQLLPVVGMVSNSQAIRPQLHVDV